MAENTKQEDTTNTPEGAAANPPEELAFTRERLGQYEGKVQHPYLDTKGFVTIGVGFNVDDVESFKALPLVYVDGPESSRLATDEEKEAAHKAIKAETTGKRYPEYKDVTMVRLPSDYIQSKLDEEILQRRDIAIKNIGQDSWDKLTIPQRAAIIDVVFNVKNFSEYKKLIAAAKSGDELTLAQESLASIDPVPNKKSDNKHHWARSRGKFCDILGYGPNKCERAFEGFLSNQTLFRKTTDKDKEDAGVYTPPPGVEGDESEFTETEKKLFSVEAKHPAPPPKPEIPVQPAGSGTSPPASQPQAGPAPRPGQTPPGQTPPGQPRPGQPGQGPGQAPGQRPAQGPVPPAGAPVPPPPAHGPGRGDERGSLSPEGGFGKLADIPANDVASKDDRDGRQGTPMRMEDYERILGHDVFRDEVAAHMAEPNPEDDGPADKRMQFGINMALIAHGRMPKYVNGERAVMAPPRHDIEGKPIKDTLAKTSQNFAAMADRIGVIPAVKATQGALNDLRGPAEPIKEDGEFGPISKETMRDRLFRYGYDKVRLQMQQRYQAMRRQGEERR